MGKDYTFCMVLFYLWERFCHQVTLKKRSLVMKMISSCYECIFHTVLQIPLDELATPQNVFWFVVICYISWLSLSLLLLLLLKNPCPSATEPLGLKFKVILRENASIFWPCSSPLLRIRGVCTLPWRVWKQLPVIKIWYHWRKIRS